MHLAEVCLETNDVVKLADFYRKILGAPSQGGDEVHQTLIKDGTQLTVYNNGQRKDNQNRNISLAFEVEDVDKEYKRLLELGVQVIDPPMTRPWGARNLHFCDPDGNYLYFRSRIK